MGFSGLPYSGSSDMIKSISTFAWMKSPSVERLTVPLIPIKQCSLVLWKTALCSRFLEWPGLLMFVRIQHMSSHLLKPHFFRQSRPMSRPEMKQFKLARALAIPVGGLFGERKEGKFWKGKSMKGG